jgi:hypothetical protein
MIISMLPVEGPLSGPFTFEFYTRTHGDLIRMKPSSLTSFPTETEPSRPA